VQARLPCPIRVEVSGDIDRSHEWLRFPTHGCHRAHEPMDFPRRDIADLRTSSSGRDTLDIQFDSPAPSRACSSPSNLSPAISPISGRNSSDDDSFVLPSGIDDA